MRSVYRSVGKTLPRSNFMLRTAPNHYTPISSTKFNTFSFRTFADAAKGKTEDNANTSAGAEDASNLTVEQKTIKDLEVKLESKTKDALELRDRLLRSVADFRNLQEVTKKDVKKAKDFALQKFAKDLLESVDNFGHALSAFKDEDVKKSKEINDLYTGVRMTRDVFLNTLKKHGIEKLDPLGEVFDPNKHEATFELPQPDKEPGTVFHVQQLGYTLNERVIRPAKVGIVKGSDN
ncbi:similar to Saccharomyces cerevisiae YOR232W MGE1 Mitochondrial matrix cochaperone, acts as a nucleotide release factor for Ssc1p in protein translocation and folding [Maudiozyma saulgeensis]|uniref:GrpE protein homolog n=1 Tax=Maudiozyma saulgeensis TaxID=1789683 RepID=A0A1X7R3S3_9SACH|nr:similar to Saccharomyces cerevisiae YOR232W MGE1 Mitochondrial matrix cochaperone, acts as a nucleotide release factor for Ssc1p in protein translocation and folding [Kazachstania saulgeensis]